MDQILCMPTHSLAKKRETQWSPLRNYNDSVKIAADSSALLFSPDPT